MTRVMCGCNRIYIIITNIFLCLSDKKKPTYRNGERRYPQTHIICIVGKLYTLYYYNAHLQHAQRAIYLYIGI